MVFPEQTIFLRDGTTLTIRSAGPEDAEAMLTCLDATTAETPYLLREPGKAASLSNRNGSSCRGGWIRPGT